MSRPRAALRREVLPQRDAVDVTSRLGERLLVRRPQESPRASSKLPLQSRIVGGHVDREFAERTLANDQVFIGRLLPAQDEVVSVLQVSHLKPQKRLLTFDPVGE